MGKYIDPFTDTGFKIIFGRENQSEIILAKFLNDLFEGEPGFEPVKSVKYINSERARVKEKGKTIIHDVICETVTGHRFILEMQKGKKDDFIYRSTYYTCRGVTDQISISSANSSILKYNYLPVTSVFICQFDIDGLDKKLTSHFLFRESETQTVLTTHIRSAYIQLPQFNKEWEQCENNFDRWIYILKNMEKLKEFPLLTRKDKVFARLEQVASYAALAEEDRIAYEADLKWASEYEEELATAKRQAAREGREEGRAQGIAEGRAEGIIEGKIESAKLMLADGLSLDMISKYVDIPLNDLKDILSHI